MEKKKILLPTERYAKAPEEELSIKINLSSDVNLIRENDKNIVLDSAELFNKERNKSVKYKIYGKIRMIFDNFYSGNTDYTYLKDRLYLVGNGSTSDYTGYIPYNEFAFLRNDILREKNNPLSGDTLINFQPDITLDSNLTGHTTLTDITAPYQNWNLYLSYVYTGVTNLPITYTLSSGTKYDFTSSDGIPFILSSDNNYYILTSPVEHGMKAGEYIVLSGDAINSLSLNEKTFYIDSVGNEIHRSEKYVINILKKQLRNNIVLTNGTVYFGKRCLDNKNITGTTSQYYVQKHKILTSTSDYILDNLGFESSIWRDEKKIIFENYSGVNDFLVEKNRMESVLYDFKQPFLLSGITNNLGFTPTEIYVSIIFSNGNGYFDYPPKVGWGFNFHDTWIDKHFDGDKSNETNLKYSNFFKIDGTTTYNFRSGTTLNIGDELLGAYVEYNQLELKERIISEANHKFTSPITLFNHNQNLSTYYSGATNTNKVGLYYQPHYRIKLRELSPYIETSKTDDVINLPENVKYFPEEKLWRWRDLYEHGFIDVDGFGTSYPFVNDTHNVKLDINFYLKNEKNYTNKKDEVNKFIFRIINC